MNNPTITYSPYYFDCETYSPNSKITLNDTIISIQYQPLDYSGKAMGDLTILKAWQSSEEQILKTFYNIFSPCKSFKFVPIGTSLNSFDFLILYNAYKRHHITINLQELIHNHTNIDLKPILVLMNRADFKGSSLSTFSNKPPNNKYIAQWYNEKQYDKIEEYIRQEAKEFIAHYISIVALLAEYGDKIKDSIKTT